MNLNIVTASGKNAGKENEMTFSYQPLECSVNESFFSPALPLRSPPQKINSGSLLMSAADGIIRRQQGCAKGKQTLLRPSTCPPRTDVTQWLVVTLSGRCCRDPPGRICLFGMNKSVCVCVCQRKEK